MIDPEWKRVIWDKETASDPKESLDSDLGYSDTLLPEGEQNPRNPTDSHQELRTFCSSVPE